MYLIGDVHQRIYRWRGASDNFETADVDTEFALTESFRFGVKIARQATLVLRLKGCSHSLVGLGPAGKVKGPDSTLVLPCTMLARTNKGVFDLLYQHVVHANGGWQTRTCSESGRKFYHNTETGESRWHQPRQRTWAWHRDKPIAYMLDFSKLEPYTNLFNGEGTVRVSGEVFKTVDGLRDWAEDEGDTVTLTKLQIAEEYQHESLELITAALRRSNVRGAGKTTTAVLVAHKILQRSPTARVLYVVFNAAACEDARRRFPSDGVEVVTAHSFAHRRMGQPDVATKNLTANEVVTLLELQDWVKRHWQPGCR